MSLYQTVKSAITVRQVGEMYGMEPDRHGMVCCPFHSDNHPSMMLNESYYYCFACGANGDAIDLTAKEYDLVELLMKNPRRVYSRESLMDLVWGYSYAGDYRTVDVHIRRLREKLERVPAEPAYIITKWGVGYYFAGEDQPTI